jgi:hypothetical protein
VVVGSVVVGAVVVVASVVLVVVERILDVVAFELPALAGDRVFPPQPNAIIASPTATPVSWVHRPSLISFLPPRNIRPVKQCPAIGALATDRTWPHLLGIVHARSRGV